MHMCYTKDHVLRTLLLLLDPQDNEETVCLLLDADTGMLHLADMLLDLELFLAFAIDRWTDCMTRQPYAVGSGMVSPF